MDQVLNLSALKLRDFATAFKWIPIYQRPMKKLALFASIALVVAVVFALLKFSVAPGPVAVMTASTFDRADQIGTVVYKRFYDPLSRAPVVVFGAPPNPAFHARILEGFLAEAASLGHKFDLIYQEPGVAPILAAAGAVIEPFGLNGANLEEFATRIKAEADAGKRVLVYTASTFSSHKLLGNPIARLEAAMGGAHLFAITSGTLVLRATHENLIDPPCVGEERDKNGTSKLGCMMLMASRRIYRKRLTLDKFVAIMDEEAPGDFLLLTSSPVMAKRAESGNVEPAAPMPKTIEPDSEL